MERIGQTVVLGELLAGVIVGPGVLGLVHESEALHAMAELGMLILLFEVGLESDLAELLRAGLEATLVALVGVAVPFAVGYGVRHWLGHPPLLAVFVGATFTATSVGITARVLRDLGRLKDAAAKVVLLADLMRLATIIGTFAAGLIVATTERRAHVEERIKPVADLLVPVFFVTVGMKVQPAMLNPFGQSSQFGLAMLLTAVAVASKLAAGLGVYRRGIRRWPVAVGMVPRGEVGLIFAGVGLASGVVAEGLYSALVVVVMLTTFAAPPWLKALYRE